MARCLIIEDSSTVSGILADILDELGQLVDTASGPATAMDKCREGLPDLVLLDWDLPDLGALDFLRDLHAESPDNKPLIILMATENDPRQFALARAAGAPYHILKPFDVPTIRSALRKAGVLSVLDHARPAPASDLRSALG
jgi:two-component system chemotaxis response regulator CheY